MVTKLSESKDAVYLAVDLGASSGRVLAGAWSGSVLELIDVHRFSTPSQKIRGKWHWDILYLYSEILTGLRLASQRFGDRIVSVGVDTWGVDYGLLDEDGELLANPVCYRDGRTDGVQEEVCSALTKERIYAETGIQFMFFNTIFQFAAERRENRAAFRSAKRMLFLPDLLNFWLCGKQATERSIASTSQMLNPNTRDWSEPILDHLGLEKHFLGEVVEAGTKLGQVTLEVANAIGRASVDVVAAAGHDTASAFMALPETRPDHAVLSSGTWSIMGLELDAPNCSSEALEAGFSNEIGFEGTVRFLKNICGFWLLEECRRQWATEGLEISYDEIVKQAQVAEPLRSLIDPDDARFAKPGDMPTRIRAFCGERGEPTPESPQQLVRCIFDSLALKYNRVFESLARVSGRELAGLFVLGGGVRNALVNQLTADALGLPVVGGAAEATAIGNVMAQMIAAGDAKDLADARRLVSPSFPSVVYQPNPNSPIRAARGRFESLCDSCSL